MLISSGWPTGLSNSNHGGTWQGRRPAARLGRHLQQRLLLHVRRIPLVSSAFHCLTEPYSVSGYFTNEISHSALLYQLLRDPSSMQRLKREVCSAFSSLDSISAERCISLPFLNACIQESLRLLPPLAGKFMSRKSPGATIDGLWVPYGTQVYCEAYTMQRSPLYWTDPDSFRPDRWLDNGPESRHAHDVRHSFKPFSSGPRTCIGREMALQTLRLTTAKLVYKYDMESERPDCFVWERDCASSALWSNYRLPVRMALRPKDG
ncbi:Cytochrome P450 [Macrophomina phaseolina MS6]|uniref:Cytochrome P450 n=1 Tax=Macrophomina phaseolina (strain MS6) TaxID=1126212 RepID=K2RLE3_MACPH|nr:Cytochrome P450 [Macrophomina phaseolina MS6]